jgi:cytidyltransferase-like protein
MLCIIITLHLIINSRYKYIQLIMSDKQTIVYCDGVYDIIHYGHMEHFIQSAKHGDYLKVGVHDDETVMSFKRKPIMIHEERCITVSKCRDVDEVIPNAPLVITEEYLKKHNIDIVVCSEEYDREDNDYYAVPRRLGILRTRPRTKEISSTDIMNRLKDRYKIE